MNEPTPPAPEVPMKQAGRSTAAFAWLVFLLSLGFGVAQVYPMLADSLTADERVSLRVQEAQAERVQRGLKPLVLAFMVQGEVSSIDANTSTITMWGSAWPEQLPDGMLLDEVEGNTPQTSTLVVRNIDPATVTVGKGSRGRAFFVERRLVPNRAGQPPVYEWVYDMDQSAALERLRKRANEGR